MSMCSWCLTMNLVAQEMVSSAMFYDKLINKIKNLLISGQNPYSLSASKSAAVAHQSQPSDLPASVQSLYCLSSYLKGNTHGCPLAFPCNVKISRGKNVILVMDLSISMSI